MDYQSLRLARFELPKLYIFTFLLPLATESKFKLRGFVAERKGERDDMQDAHVICDDFLEEFDLKPVGM